MKSHLATAMALVGLWAVAGQAETDPAWMIEFADIVAITRALPTTAHQALDDHFTANVTPAYFAADRRARKLAAAHHRLPWAAADLAHLRLVCPAAALTATAVLVRDLLPRHGFQVLTAAWTALDLRLPGRDDTVH